GGGRGGGGGGGRRARWAAPAPAEGARPWHCAARPTLALGPSRDEVSGRPYSIACASAGVHGLPSTRRRSSFPTLKNGTRLACTATRAPVLGFRPSRAWRCFTTKLPKPRISMRSPRVRACVMLSKTAFTITSASRREKRGNCFSTSSIRSRLAMRGSSILVGERSTVEEEEAPGERAARGQPALAEQVEPPEPTVRPHD